MPIKQGKGSRTGAFFCASVSVKKRFSICAVCGNMKKKNSPRKTRENLHLADQEE